MSSEQIRRVIFRPYRKGMGPSFTLTLWDAGERWDGHQRRSCVRYRLTQSEHGTLFEGADFSPSPMHATDSDACVRGIMGFLTLRPGDTDSDYFQRRFYDEHADALGAEVMARFGEDS